VTTARVVTAPSVRPVMQVAVGDVDVAVGQAVYDTARYDQYPDATYSGLDAQWADDSCDVIEAVTFYGRERAVDQFDVGTATLRVANPDGLWDYPPTSDASVISLRPGRQLRVGVQVGGGVRGPVWLWHGWIDATAPGYDPAIGDVVDVSCVCAKGEAGRGELAKLDAAVGDGETVTQRMTRYADAAAFPAHRRQFDGSGTTLVATTLGGRVGALMDRSARSAGGDVFGDQHGYLTYRSQDWQTRGPGVPPDAYIGNRGLPDEVCPNTWEVLFNRSDFTTRVNYGQAGGPVSTIDDVPNRDRYGVETVTMTDLETVDAPTRTLLAQRVLKVRNFNLAPRVAAVTLDAARDGVTGLLSNADPYLPSMYSCGHVTKDGRPVFARTMYLTGIEHTIDAGHWTARLALDDAGPWQTNSDARYDAAHYNADHYAKAV
jgi:hypothetical protein